MIGPTPGPSSSRRASRSLRAAFAICCSSTRSSASSDCQCRASSNSAPRIISGTSSCINPVNLEHVLRQIQTNYANLAHGRLPCLVESHHQSGTLMPSGAVHPIIAGSLGVSAIILASAQLFTGLKLVGALYLIWLGIRTFREAGNAPPEQIAPIGAKRAFREGVVVEALNPKTAAFFLAFIPQFLEPAAGYPALQFMALGLISVALNTFADVIVVVAAAAARVRLVRQPHLIQRLRQGSGMFMAGL